MKVWSLIRFGLFVLMKFEVEVVPVVELPVVIITIMAIVPKQVLICIITGSIRLVA